MFVSGMGENSQSNYAGQMGDAIIQSKDQGETNKLAFSHQFTGGLGLKIPLGTAFCLKGSKTINARFLFSSKTDSDSNANT